MTGTYTYVVASAEDNNPLIVKQNVAAMLQAIQGDHPGAVVTSFSWVNYDVINQVNYNMEYSY